jgi:hypothetical protein
VAISAPPSTTLDVYGLRIRVGGAWPEVIESLRLDFAWFVDGPGRDGAAASDVEVEVRHGAPDFDAFGSVPAAFVTPRNVVYELGDRKVVEYFGRALSVMDRTSGRLTVQGEDRQLVHEAAYHYIVSRVGEHLDARGLTRLHALGLAGADGAVAVMLPSGGGKSTLVLRALRDERVRLLSEDTPLLDRRGMLHPFPLRIGVNATDAAELPEGAVRRIERMEFHPKLAVELEAFGDAQLRPAVRRAAIGPLLREAIVGVGVYQGMEFVLQRGMRDTFGKLDVAARRAACCAAALRHARIWHLTVGRDRERNWAELEPLLR